MNALLRVTVASPDSTPLLGSIDDTFDDNPTFYRDAVGKLDRSEKDDCESRPKSYSTHAMATRTALPKPKIIKGDTRRNWSPGRNSQEYATHGKRRNKISLLFSSKTQQKLELEKQSCIKHDGSTTHSTKSKGSLGSSTTMSRRRGERKKSGSSMKDEGSVYSAKSRGTTWSKSGRLSIMSTTTSRQSERSNRGMRRRGSAMSSNTTSVSSAIEHTIRSTGSANSSMAIARPQRRRKQRRRYRKRDQPLLASKGTKNNGKIQLPSTHLNTHPNRHSIVSDKQQNGQTNIIIRNTDDKRAEQAFPVQGSNDPLVGHSEKGLSRGEDGRGLLNSGYDENRKLTTPVTSTIEDSDNNKHDAVGFPEEQVNEHDPTQHEHQSRTGCDTAARERTDMRAKFNYASMAARQDISRRDICVLMNQVTNGEEEENRSKGHYRNQDESEAYHVEWSTQQAKKPSRTDLADTDGGKEASSARTYYHSIQEEQYGKKTCKAPHKKRRQQQQRRPRKRRDRPCRGGGAFMNDLPVLFFNTVQWVGLQTGMVPDFMEEEETARSKLVGGNEEQQDGTSQSEKTAFINARFFEVALSNYVEEMCSTIIEDLETSKGNDSNNDKKNLRRQKAAPRQAIAKTDHRKRTRKSDSRPLLSKNHGHVKHFSQSFPLPEQNEADSKNDVKSTAEIDNNDMDCVNSHRHESALLDGRRILSQDSVSTLSTNSSFSSDSSSSSSFSSSSSSSSILAPLSHKRRIPKRIVISS